MTFGSLPLHPDLIQGIKHMGYVDPTPVQREVIPPACEGRDVVASAHTGTGKTAAYVLPLMHRMLQNPPAVQRVLVLLPTRELAAQVETAVRDLGRFTPFKAALLLGGESFHKQVQSLRQNPQFIVATPGRLIDHLHQKTLQLNNINALVLDEADRMLDMGFAPALREILHHLPKQRQTMFLSATMPPEIERLAQGSLHNPVRVDVGGQARPTPAAGITQILYPVSDHQKRELMIALLKKTSVHSGIIFCRTKHGADRLANALKNQALSVGVLHSDRSQSERTRTLDAYRQGKLQILVATNIAARGLDIKHVTHVINYDVPRFAEDYVHRVGRTARAEAIGDAITLVSPDEEKFVMIIERYISATIPRAALPDFNYDIPPRLVIKPKSIRDAFSRRKRFAPRRSGRFGR